jgi:ATP-binding cassette subfamily F protein 3
VSHDRALLTSLTNRIWAIESQRVEDYPGNFAEWEVDRAKLKESEKARKRENDKAASRSPSRRRQAAEMPATAEAPKRSKTSRADTEQLEARVTALEAQLADVERQLADPALYAGSGNHT